MPRASCLVPTCLVPALVILLTSAPVNAQTPERLPWFAVDLHAASVGLPTAEGWIPVPVLGDTPLAGRTFGAFSAWRFVEPGSTVALQGSLRF